MKSIVDQHSAKPPHLRLERQTVLKRNEQRRKGISKLASIPRLHLPSGGLLVAGAEVTPRQDPCGPRSDQTCRQASPPKRMALRYGLHPRVGRRSGMVGQIKRRTFVSLGRGQGQKEKQEATSRPSDPWLNWMSAWTHTTTWADNFNFGEHVVTFAREQTAKQANSWENMGKPGLILFSGASCSPLKNEHSMREWTRVYSIKPERML